MKFFYDHPVIATIVLLAEALINAWAVLCLYGFFVVITEDALDRRDDSATLYDSPRFGSHR